MSQPKGTGTFWEDGKLVERDDDDDPDMDRRVAFDAKKRAQKDRSELESRRERLLMHYPPPPPPPVKKGRPPDDDAMTRLIFDIWRLQKLRKKQVHSRDEFVEILKSEVRSPWKLSEILREEFPLAYPKEDARNRVRKLKDLLGV